MYKFNGNIGDMIRVNASHIFDRNQNRCGNEFIEGSRCVDLQIALLDPDGEMVATQRIPAIPNARKEFTTVGGNSYTYTDTKALFGKKYGGIPIDREQGAGIQVGPWHQAYPWKDEMTALGPKGYPMHELEPEDPAWTYLQLEKPGLGTLPRYKGFSYPYYDEFVQQAGGVESAPLSEMVGLNQSKTFFSLLSSQMLKESYRFDETKILLRKSGEYKLILFGSTARTAKRRPQTPTNFERYTPQSDVGYYALHLRRIDKEYPADPLVNDILPEPKGFEENGCSNLHVDTFPNHARKHVNCEWFTPRDANLKSGWAGEAEDKIVELNRAVKKTGTYTIRVRFQGNLHKFVEARDNRRCPVDGPGYDCLPKSKLQDGHIRFVSAGPFRLRVMESVRKEVHETSEIVPERLSAAERALLRIEGDAVNVTRPCGVSDAIRDPLNGLGEPGDLCQRGTFTEGEFVSLSGGDVVCIVANTPNAYSNNAMLSLSTTNSDGKGEDLLTFVGGGEDSYLTRADAKDSARKYHRQ